jgi:hypothetical protein
VYRPLRDLAAVLRRGGVSNVQEIAGWQDRGRPPSTGDFDPHGILCHHTASPDSWGDADDIRVILAGNSEAPGPISQLYVSRHEPWPVYVLAAGRANHGGRGDIGFGCADMNAALVGIEAGQSGSTHWPDGMIVAYGRTVAALMRGYGWEPSNVHLHHTTGPQCGNFKVDPSGPWLRQPELPLDNPGASQWDLSTWRSYVAEWLGAPPSTPTEDDMFILTSTQNPNVSWLIMSGYRVRLSGPMAYGTEQHPEARMLDNVKAYWTDESIETFYPLVPGAAANP